MALLKSLRRTATETPEPPKGAPSASAEAVQQARVQARRRLIGAVILLGIGVIGFPIVFQTQPRPIPVDIPIEIPKRDGAPALAMATGGGAAGSGGSGGAAASPGSAGTQTQSSPQAQAAQQPPGAQQTQAGRAATTPVEPVEVEVVKPAAVTAPPAAATATAAVAATPPSAPAPASAAAAATGRFIVQAGSYTDAETVREVRARLEKMGLKTYTQVAVIEGVSRTRVRVGPYTNRAEALEVQNKIKAAGVAASLLVL